MPTDDVKVFGLGNIKLVDGISIKTKEWYRFSNNDEELKELIYRRCEEEIKKTREKYIENYYETTDKLSVLLSCMGFLIDLLGENIAVDLIETVKKMAVEKCKEC